ncbi:conserved protein of unknown function [Pararobbsia alpina]|uniref:hypothetical protein n=1 Tax=Pararobbsia alpina TaxID=621374 RepID=UPI0039A740FD
MTGVLAIEAPTTKTGCAVDRIDDLLFDWYIWSQGYNPGVDYQAFDSSCAQSRTSRQWMDYDEIDAEVEWAIKKGIGKLLDPMIQKLHLPARVAINTAMRNFEAGVEVWSSMRLHGVDLAAEYAQAKAILCPQLVAAGLLTQDACKPAETAL